MTDPRRLLRRAWCAVLLGTQVLGGAVPLADALLEGASNEELHIEARAEHACTVVHDHASCALCHHLGHADAALAAGPGGLAPARSAAGRTGVDEADLARTHFHPHGRSPPVV